MRKNYTISNQGFPLRLMLKAGIGVVGCLLFLLSGKAYSDPIKDTVPNVVNTLLTPFRKKIQADKDSLKNSVDKNVNKADSLVPKTDKARYRREAKP